VNALKTIAFAKQKMDIEFVFTSFLNLIRGIRLQLAVKEDLMKSLPATDDYRRLRRAT
jgi:hypothetical protein